MDYELSLIVPAFNEEQNIIPFCQMVEQDLAPRMEGRLEVILVDDGSADATFSEMQKAVEYCKEFCDVSAIRFSRNFGKESAMLAGLKQSQGSFCGFIDVDLQQPASDMANMLDMLKASPNADCVAAVAVSRTKGGLSSKLSESFYTILSKSSNMDVVENASDFRVFRRNVADALISMPEYYRFSKGLFAWVGFETIPYDYTPQSRHAGETNWPLRSLCSYAINGLLSFTTAPLRLATYVGIITSILAGAYLILQVFQRIHFGVDVPGYATIVVLILFFGGLQMIMLGIVGEYLGRLYIESKRRPVYLVKQILSSSTANKAEAPQCDSDGTGSCESNDPNQETGPSPEGMAQLVRAHESLQADPGFDATRNG